MSKVMFVGDINNIARKIKNIYLGKNGVAYKIKKAYIGVNGTAHLFYENASGHIIEIVVPQNAVLEVTKGALVIKNGDTVSHGDTIKINGIPNEGYEEEVTNVVNTEKPCRVTIPQVEGYTTTIRVDGVDYTESFDTFAGMKYKISVKNNPGYKKYELTNTEGIIEDNVTLGIEAYTVTINQTPNQLITVIDDNNISHTESFTVIKGTTWTASIESTDTENYFAGTLSATSGIVNSNTIISATPAVYIENTTITIKQSANQTITVECNGVYYTETFTVKQNLCESWNASIISNYGYDPGTLSATSGILRNGNTTVSATNAIEKPVYTVTITQSANQTIYVNGRGYGESEATDHTSNFTIYRDNEINVRVVPDSGYAPGFPNINSIIISKDIQIIASNASELPNIDESVIYYLAYDRDQIINLNDYNAPYNVSKIGSYAFFKTNFLLQASFTNCTSIEDYAFYTCSKLTSVNFPNCSYIGSSTFQSCSNLKTASFPNCSYIGSNAFRYCTSLTTASFPKCTSIGDYAFQSCTSLTTASFPNCTSIESYAFHFCPKLTTISFPVCSYIGISAFYACSSLTTASFPKCTSIGSYAFGACYRLTTISFPICSYIGIQGLAACSKLTSASFPVCSYIGNYAFYNCYTLTTVSFPKCSYIGSSAFYRCSKLTSASFPVCSYIGSSAFYNCSSLTTISFPVCSYIGSYAFGTCTKLTSAIFPKCSYIGSWAFASCSSLTTISFPNCSYIGDTAFASCYKLMSLYLMSTSVVSLNRNPFYSTPIINSSYTGNYGSIFVPASLLNSYKTATAWSDYSDRIVGV